MRKLLVLIVLLALGAGIYWYAGRKSADQDALRKAEAEASQRLDEMKSTIKDKLGGLSIDPKEIKEELERSGKVVRKKAEQVGAVIADAAITAAIKAKLVKDPNLSALRIAVNTTDGVVTLSGSVDSVEEIQQALKLALETEGVREAISTLQVRVGKKE
jgi:hyperosmotically inducible protein